MSSPISIESDRRTRVEADTIRAGFLDQGFINTMRFSELNGLEEYDNTHLYVDWHALFSFGLQQLFEWKEWIKRQEDETPIWNTVPEEQKKAIQRTFTDLDEYEITKPIDDKQNIKVLRNLAKYDWNICVGCYVYDGHVGILNGRMARDKGHKKDLLKITENQNNRKPDIHLGDEDKKHWYSR